MLGDHSGHGFMPTLALANDCEEQSAGGLPGEKSLNATVPCFLFGVISESDGWTCCSQFAVQMEQTLEKSQYNEDSRAESWE